MLLIPILYIRKKKYTLYKFRNKNNDHKKVNLKTTSLRKVLFLYSIFEKIKNIIYKTTKLIATKSNNFPINCPKFVYVGLKKRSSIIIIFNY